MTHDHELPAGWQPVAATRNGASLQLFVNGEKVGQSTELQRDQFDLTNNLPLKIGSGRHDDFNGRLRDVRLYSRALTAQELKDLADEAHR
ncbi:LamG domain-containing protein [Planctomicrobium sp. SH661]|uniref:LamG domain-containing protein n=1 Tax=Planctomicrobium sp. SH661 TaxID=3448124 RepID=UPI003F5C30A1